MINCNDHISGNFWEILTSTVFVLLSSSVCHSITLHCIMLKSFTYLNFFKFPLTS